MDAEGYPAQCAAGAGKGRVSASVKNSHFRDFGVTSLFYSDTCSICIGMMLRFCLQHLHCINSFDFFALLDSFSSAAALESFSYPLITFSFRQTHPRAFSYPLTWTITSILFILYYKRGKWMQKDTLRNAPQGREKTRKRFCKKEYVVALLSPGIGRKKLPAEPFLGFSEFLSRQSLFQGLCRDFLL